MADTLRTTQTPNLHLCLFAVLQPLCGGALVFDGLLGALNS